MVVEELLKDIERSHMGLQHLRIEATESNLNIILDALNTLKRAHAFISILNEPDKEPEAVKEKLGDGDA